MAILALFTGDIEQGMYEQLRSEVNWESDLADGGLFHVAAFDDAGNIRVADVWESPEALDAFVSGRLAPAMEKLGIPQPDVQVFPAHNINAYPAIEAHKISA